MIPVSDIPIQFEFTYVPLSLQLTNKHAGVGIPFRYIRAHWNSLSEDALTSLFLCSEVCQQLDIKHRKICEAYESYQISFDEVRSHLKDENSMSLADYNDLTDAIVSVYIKTLSVNEDQHCEEDSAFLVEMFLQDSLDDAVVLYEQERDESPAIKLIKPLWDK